MTRCFILRLRGLAFLLAWALPTRNGRVLLNVLIAMAVVTTYGCLDEISQLFVPGRHGCFSDFLADTLGGLFGVIVYSIGRKILMSRELGKRLVDLMSH